MLTPIRDRFPFLRHPPMFERPVEDADQLTLSLYLKPKAAIPGRHRRRAPERKTHLTLAELWGKHGAADHHVERVCAYFRARGIQVLDAHAGRRCVIIQGPAPRLGALFGVKLGHFRHRSAEAPVDPSVPHAASHEFIFHEGEYQIPLGLRSIVQAVVGLDNRPIENTNLHLQPRTADDAILHPGFRPEVVAKTYGFPEGLTGKGQTIGIIALGGEYSEADMTTFLGKSLPKPVVIKEVGEQSADLTRGTLELMMDLEIAAAVAPDAQLVVYRSRSTLGGIIDAFNAALNDAQHKPGIISISWGHFEDAWPKTNLEQLEQLFKAAAEKGITVLAAAGDQGSSDGGTDGKVHVDFPASSLHVTTCGGTSLTVAADGTVLEVVWDNNDLTAATGGGVSNFFTKPTWQAKVPVPKRADGKTGRGVPDLAGHADPTKGYQLRVNGQNTVAAGTSAVAPLMAGLIARINEARATQGAIGYLNHLLYGLNLETVFFPITVGDNGQYKAGIGWDAVTGLGRPKGQALLDAVKGMK